MGEPQILNIDGDFESPYIDCRYYSPAQLKTRLNSYDESSFSVFAANVRSCRKNFSSLTGLLSTILFKFSIIILVETWLNQDIDHCFNIDGYKQINLYRNSHGGGIKVLFMNELCIQILDDFTLVSELLEIVTFYIFGKNFKYLVSVIYRPPSASARNFNEVFFNDFIDKFPRGVRTFLIGDFNLNL